MPCLPSTHPDFYISVPAEPGRQQNLGHDPFKGAKANVLRTNDGKVMCELPIGRLGEGKGTSWAQHDLTIDKRVHYIHQADQVITIPFTNDRLLITRFSLAEALRESDTAFVYATSTPPRACTKGQLFEYQLRYASSSDEVDIELSAAPEGMKMSKEAKITWPVPETLDDNLVFVIFTLSTGDGQTVFHTLRLSVRDG
jgi:hypothetical protein